MDNSSSCLFKAAAWATILGAFIAVLAYLDIDLYVSKKKEPQGPTSSVAEVDLSSSHVQKDALLETHTKKNEPQGPTSSVAEVGLSSPLEQEDALLETHTKKNEPQGPTSSVADVDLSSPLEQEDTSLENQTKLTDISFLEPALLGELEEVLETFTQYNIEPEQITQEDRQMQHEKKLTFQIKDVSFNMVCVEGGFFRMGASLLETIMEDDGNSNEVPAHQVTLSTYYIGETEVTQALWTAVMNNNPSHLKGMNRPVGTVSWNECQEFIKKLNAATGKSFRLPTEAEWEFAARGGNKSNGFRFSGSNSPGYVAWYNKNSGGETQDIAQREPNELGLYDMSGNVWEWCNDLFGEYDSYPQKDPKGSGSGQLRVCRGGSYCYDAYECRVSCRIGVKPDGHFIDAGLRLALSEEQIIDKSDAQ